MCDHVWTYFVDSSSATKTLELLLKSNHHSCRRFATSKLFLDSVDLTSCGCIVINVDLSGGDGEQLLQLLGAQRSPLSILMHARNVDVPTAAKWMEHGVQTVLQNSSSPETLLAAVRRGLIISQSRRQRLRRTATVKERLATLNREEREILEILLAGGSNKRIAEELVLSDRTVARRRHDIMEKMYVGSLVELCRLLFTTGLYHG